MSALSRYLRHLLSTRRQVKRHFPEHCLKAIKAAIAAAEAGHREEIHFAIEAALTPGQLLQGMTAHERALEVFSSLRVWDTEYNNGVLIYVLLADKSVDIIADRGIHAKIGGDEAWRRIVGLMQSAFTEGRFEEGAVAGVAAVAQELAKHFPSHGTNTDELPNDVSFL